MMEPLRQAIRRDIASSIRELGLLHARRARSNENADAIRSVLLLRGLHAQLETILRQCECRESIVPAIPLRPWRVERAIEARDFAQRAIEQVRIEVEFAQPAAFRAQCFGVREASCAKRGRDGV